MKCVIILLVAVSCCWASKCDVCSNPDFMGFGFEPSNKCGCCPWPCCCKCVQTIDDRPGYCPPSLDMAFIMDASGSIGTSDWVVARQFFGDIVSQLKNVGDGQQVAAITFATNASLQWNLNDDQTSSMDKLQKAISGLENIGSFTNIAEALELTLSDVFTESDVINRNNGPNMAVLMTDGRSNFRHDEVATFGAQLQAISRTVCIGVTNQVDIDELRLVCAEDAIFTVNDFSELQSIINHVQQIWCPVPEKIEKCYCCCTPEMFWGAGGAKW